MLLVRNNTFLPVSNSVSFWVLCFCLFLINITVFGSVSDKEGLKKGDSQSLESFNLDNYALDDLQRKSIEELLPEGVLLSQSLINTPMPKLKASKLGKLLTHYYNKSLGGSEHWETVKSIKISGDLSTLSGLYQYHSISKKPNLYKIAITLDGQSSIFAFDGRNKWQMQITEEEEIFPEMTPEMDRMINETELPIYLLYPLQTGQAYQYLGTVREFNTVCHKLRLFTKRNYVIDYFIDVESHFIVTIHVFDTLKEFSPVIVRYSDYKLVEGLYFAHQVESYVDGLWDSSLSINSIGINQGVTDWMFYLDYKSP